MALIRFFKKILAVRYETVISPLSPVVSISSQVDEIVENILNKVVEIVGRDYPFNDLLLKRCMTDFLQNNDAPPLHKIEVTMEMNIRQMSKIWKIEFPGFLYGKLSSHFVGWENGPSPFYRMEHTSTYREEGLMEKIPQLKNRLSLVYGQKYYAHDYSGKYTHPQSHQFGYYEYSDFQKKMVYKRYKLEPLRALTSDVYQQNISDIALQFLGKVVTVVGDSRIHQVMITKVITNSSEKSSRPEPVTKVEAKLLSVSTQKGTLLIAEGFLMPKKGEGLTKLLSAWEIGQKFQLEYFHNGLNLLDPTSKIQIEDLGVVPKQKTISDGHLERVSYRCDIDRYLGCFATESISLR